VGVLGPKAYLRRPLSYQKRRMVEVVFNLWKGPEKYFFGKSLVI